MSKQDLVNYIDQLEDRVFYLQKLLYEYRTHIRDYKDVIWEYPGDLHEEYGFQSDLAGRHCFYYEEESDEENLDRIAEEGFLWEEFINYYSKGLWDPYKETSKEKRKKRVLEIFKLESYYYGE